MRDWYGAAAVSIWWKVKTSGMRTEPCFIWSPKPLRKPANTRPGGNV